MGSAFKRRYGWIFNRAYLRFLASYVILLFLPILVFTLVNERYFVNLYRDEVLRQNEMILARQTRELNDQIDQMYAIAGQIASQSAMRGYNLTKIANYSHVKDALAGFKSTHDFFGQIAYYNGVNPKTVYTDTGTYNTYYFCRYLWGVHHVPLEDILAGLYTGTWFLPGDIEWNVSTASPAYQYIMPVPGVDNGYLIFFIPPKNLAGLVDLPGAQSVLIDSGGRVLYATGDGAAPLLAKAAGWEEGTFAQVGDGHYGMQTHTSKGRLDFLRFLPGEMVLSKVARMQKTFATILILLTVCGGALVYFLAFINYRPIRKLGDLATGKVDIPETLQGIDRARFALEKMDERYVALAQKQMREQMILNLIHGRERDSAHFVDNCVSLGFRFDNRYIRVALIQWKYDENVDLPRRFKQFFTDEYELAGMEYPRSGHYLMLIGMDSDDSRLIQDKLSIVASSFESPVRIAVGGMCESPFEIHRSYLQAQMVNQMGSGSGVLIFEEVSDMGLNFLYPKMELNALYEAIISADEEKARLVTSILSDIIRSKRDNHFTYTSLCYDVLDTFAAAREELRIQGETEAEGKFDYALLCSLPNLDAMINIVFDICDKTCKIMNVGAQTEPAADISRQALDYIDRHYMDADLCASSVAREFGMSISNLSHQFKAQTGLTLSDCISRKKLAYAERLLEDSGMRVGEVAARLGYNQPASFIRKFKQYYGATPNEYRVNNRLRQKEKG